MSIKSDNEVEYHLLESRDLELLDLAIWQGFNDETIEIRKMIFGYRKRVLASPRNTSPPTSQTRGRHAHLTPRLRSPSPPPAPLHDC
jgi:hypothetical protein